MSTVPREYFDAVEGDNQDYEKVKPVSFRDYLKKSNPTQSTPQEQAASKNFREDSINKPESTFRKYLQSRQPSETQGGDEPSALSYIQNPLESLRATAHSAPRTIYESAKLGLSTGFGGHKIAEALDFLEKNAPEKVQEFLGKIFPTYEQARSESPVQPKGAIQEIADKATRFAGETVLTGGRTTLPKLLTGSVGGALGQQAGEELDLHPLATAALAMTGGYLGHKASGIRTPKQRLTPQVEEYVQASRALGIDPLATGMNPTQLQKVAQKWSSHGHGGPEILENAYRQRSSQVANALEETLDGIGQNLYNNPVEAGEAFQQGITRANNQVEQTKRALYNAVDATIPPNERLRLRPGHGVNAERISDRLIEAQGLLEQNIANTPAESALHRRLVNARNELQQLNQQGGTIQLLDAQGNVIRQPSVYEMGVREVENARRSIGEVINWEKGGGVDKLLTPLYRELGDVLETYGRTNPAYAQARNSANQYFRDEVLNIRTNLLDAVKQGKIPEQAINKMNTVSGIRHVRQALNNLPDGQQMFDSLARYKTQQLIFDKIINPETGLMRIPKGAGNGIHNFLSKDRKLYSLIEELVPADQLRRLHQLEHVGEGLYKGFNALVNPSGTADTLLAIHEILSPAKQIAKGIGKLPTPEGLGNIAAGGAKLLAPKMMARMITDPEFANRIYELARAGDRGNWSLFNRLLDYISKEMPGEDKKSSQ